MSSIFENIRTAIAENVAGPMANMVAHSHEQMSTDDVPDLSGKVFVVTGGSEGIGYACVHTYLKKNAKQVFVLSRSEEVAQGMREDVTKDLGKDKADRITWIEIDLDDWDAVTKAAGKIAHSTDRVDGIVCNAARGIMTAQVTQDGIDRHMSVNHFAHVILVSHLLPLIKRTAEKDTVRISLQGSNAHQSAPKDVKFASLEEINKDEGPMGQYGRAKLANMLYARYLAKHLTAQNPRILANSTHPGFVETKMSKQDILEPYPVLGKAMSDFPMPLLKKSQWDGAIPTLYCSTVTTKSGEYICPPVIPEEGSPQYQDADLAEQLMKLTVQLVQQKTNAKEQGCPLQAGELSVV